MYRPLATQSKSQAAKPMDSEVSQAGKKVARDLRDLRDNAQTLRQDLKGATHAVSGAVRNTGGHVLDAAATVIHTPASMIESVRGAPIKSAILAMTIGLVFGRLYRR